MALVMRFPKTFQAVTDHDGMVPTLPGDAHDFPRLDMLVRFGVESHDFAGFALHDQIVAITENL